MTPTLRSGQLVIASKWRKPKVGQVVIAAVQGREVIKRMVGQRLGEVFLEGDNPAASTDSRLYGWVPRASLRGTVIWPRIGEPKS